MKTKKKLRSSDTAAIEDLNRQLRSALNKANYKLAADVLNQLGNTYRFLGNFEDALEKHQEEVDICKRHNLQDKMGLGIAYRNIAEVYIDMKEEDKAIPYIKQYLKLAQEQDNAVEEQRALITLARTYLCKAESAEDDEETTRKKHLEFAENYFRKAYKLIEEEKLKQQLKDEKELLMMKCNNCQNLGLCLEMQGKYKDSVVWLKKAVDLARRHRLNEYLHPSNTVLCGIYLKSKTYKEALSAVKEALGAAKSLGNHQMEAESRLLLAKTYFCMNEIDTGKKIMKKLYKQIKAKESLSSFLEEVEPLLTAAIRLCQTLDQICITEENDSLSLMNLHETAGDNYSNLQCYSHSVIHYKKAVEYAIKIGITEGKKLSRLYFSIAETYKDQGDYCNALKYYEKELTLYEDNPLEQFKTQTNIAVVKEKAEFPLDEVTQAYKASIDLAKLTSSKKREALAYQNYGLYLKTTGQTDESAVILEKVAKIKEENNFTDLEEVEENSQDNLDEDFVDLDNLSSDDESGEEDDNDKKNEVGCKRKKTSERRNEAGETRLHIAAKKGIFASVKRLIRQGHEVNVRDLAGWTPLHEAANFGHTQCIVALLKAGANVNDCGGELCEGIAPLHDALANGHLEASEALLDHGASVMIKDNNGNYPIDHLIMWRYSKDYDDSMYPDYKHMKQRLKSQMESSGITYTKKHEAAAARKGNRARGADGPIYSFMNPKGNITGCHEGIIPVRIVGDDDIDPDDVNGAKELYKSTMEGLLRNQRKSSRRRKNRRSEDPDSRPISPGPRTALIPDVLDVHEDWMEDDVGNSDKKRPFGGGGKRKRNVAEEVISRADERTCKRRSVSPGPSRRLRRHAERRSRIVVESDEEEEEPMNLGSDSESTRYDESPNLLESIRASSPIEDRIPDSPDMDLEAIEPEFSEMESFYPSQVPSGQPEVVFGRLDKIEPVRNFSPSPCESDDDVTTSDFRKISKERKRDRNVHSFSSIAKAAREMNRAQGSSSRSKGLMSVQTKLRFNKVKQPIVSSGSDQSPEHLSGESNISNFTLPRVPSSASITDGLSETGSRNVSSRLAVSSTMRSEVMRLKVKILETTLLVPVDSQNMNESVEWLCEQCAQRYLRSYGVKPILTLSTKDGALLSPTDSISLVLGTGDLELLANVISYDLPPLTERYKCSCRDMGVEIDEDILPLLTASESSNVFDVRDADLRGNNAKALFQSLQRQHSLSQLSLCGTNLYDEGVKELCKLLPTLPNLSTLDLSCNGITENGFLSLVNVFRDRELSNKGPSALSSLNISHNTLGSGISNGLCQLLHSLPNLRVLNVTNCCLTENLFYNGLGATLLKTKLEEINVSYNKLGELGVDKLLHGLNPSRLVALNLSSVGLRESDETFARHFANFLKRNEDCCYLKELYLADCGLSDTTFRSIVMEFNRLVSLEILDLSNNDLLSIVCLEDILLTCQVNHVPLKRLNLSGCLALWEKDKMITPERILSALESNLQSDRKLSYLKLTTDGPDSFDEDDELPLTSIESRMRSLWEEYFIHGCCKKDGRIVSFCSE